MKKKNKEREYRTHPHHPHIVRKILIPRCLHVGMGYGDGQVPNPHPRTLIRQSYVVETGRAGTTRFAGVVEGKVVYGPRKGNLLYDVTGWGGSTCPSMSTKVHPVGSSRAIPGGVTPHLCHSNNSSNKFTAK